VRSRSARPSPAHPRPARAAPAAAARSTTRGELRPGTPTALTGERRSPGEWCVCVCVHVHLCVRDPQVQLSSDARQHSMRQGSAIPREEPSRRSSGPGGRCQDLPAQGNGGSGRGPCAPLPSSGTPLAVSRCLQLQRLPSSPLPRGQRGRAQQTARRASPRGTQVGVRHRARAGES
jgi:hypothetical protein